MENIPVIHVDQQPDGKLITSFNRELKSAELGIVMANILRHIHRAHGPQFAAEVFGWIYRDLIDGINTVREIRQH